MANCIPSHPKVPEELSPMEISVEFAYPTAPPIFASLSTEAPVPSINASITTQHQENLTMSPFEAPQPLVFPYQAYCNMYAYNPWMAGMVAVPFPIRKEGNPNFYSNGMSYSLMTSPMLHPGYQMLMSLWNSNFKTAQQKEDKKGKKFSQRVERVLIERFERNNFIQKTERDHFAALLGLHPMQVKVWFQNRRYKQKKKEAMLRPLKYPKAKLQFHFPIRIFPKKWNVRRIRLQKALK